MQEIKITEVEFYASAKICEIDFKFQNIFLRFSFFGSKSLIFFVLSGKTYFK